MWRSLVSVCIIITLVAMHLREVTATAAADGGATKDINECANQLAGLATCLPYVQDQAKAPTPDCCSGLKQVLNTNKKCLCVIVRDRNDPQLGLNINATPALSLPSVCKAPANVSQCPVLLHLPTNSPEAQVFYQFARSSTASAPAPAASAVKGGAAGGSSSLQGSGGGGAPHTNGVDCCSRTSKSWIIVGVLISCSIVPMMG